MIRHFNRIFTVKNQINNYSVSFKTMVYVENDANVLHLINGYTCELIKLDNGVIIPLHTDLRKLSKILFDNDYTNGLSTHQEIYDEFEINLFEEWTESTTNINKELDEYFKNKDNEENLEI